MSVTSRPCFRLGFSLRSSRPVFGPLLRIVVVLATSYPVVAVSAADDAARPNIVLIMADDMGYSDIGCYGGEIETPTLDALAADGLRFTQFYNTARCCPTRASLLTGLYQHQAGIGHMMDDRGLMGYQGDLNRHCLTIAQVMKSAGYGTYMAGKWHVTKNAFNVNHEADKFNWPRQRGFDRFYGTITGAGSFYDPATLVRGNRYITPESDPLYKPKTYYYTDAISDNASSFIREHQQQSPDKPFFIYVSYTAAHWPMHALPAEIARYKGKYDSGYAPIRQARYQRMQQLGLLKPEWGMNPQAGDWESVEHKVWEARCMEVYAAMVHSMDRGIGRIVETLKQTGRHDNTLVFYLQDNGGCAEGMGRSPQQDARWVAEGPQNPQPFGPDDLQPRLVPPMQTRDGRVVRGGPTTMPGGPETYIGYGEAWANVSNTPFREYKHWVHEGGISTPLIAHWPKGIDGKRRGSLEGTPGHLIDIMATCVDLADAKYPDEHRGEKLYALQGISLRPAFTGSELKRGRPIFFEHEGNRALRDGKWKLVAKGPRGKWELYDMETDRSELHDLADAEPDRLKRYVKAWTTWAKASQVLPWPWDRKDNARYSRKRRFSLKPGDVLSDRNAPDTANRGLTIRAEIPKAGTGVIIAQGGIVHGFALYVDKERRIAFALRRQGKLTTFYARRALPQSDCNVEARLAPAGRIEISVNGEHVLSQPVPGLLTATPADACSAGEDTNDPVGDYPRSSRFRGEIASVLLMLDKRK